MKLSFGLIDPGMPGGIYATERPFLDALSGVEGVSVKSFVFGSRSTSESYGKRLVSRLRDVREFAAMLRRDKPDLVQLNSAYDKRALLRDFWFARAAHHARVPLFIKYHGTDASVFQNRLLLWHWISRRIIAWSAGVGVLSTQERELFVRGGHPASKFHLVKNVVEVDRFSGARNERHPPQLLFIGRFVPSKGLLDVIRAVSLLVHERRELTLMCVGDGPQMSEAQQLAESLGIRKYVTFTGHVPESNTTRYYMESTVLVFPTASEGFSMTIFQSVAAGLPIITTRIRAAADYLQEPMHCLWVEHGNPEMLAGKIRTLLDSPQLATQMSGENRNIVRQFERTTIALEYLDLYHRLIHADN